MWIEDRYQNAVIVNLRLHFSGPAYFDVKTAYERTSESFVLLCVFFKMNKRRFKIDHKTNF